MKIAIASGKGGTGKTTVATSLTRILALERVEVAHLDCDVEELNGHNFLRPKITRACPVGVPIPKVEKARCRGVANAARFVSTMHSRSLTRMYCSFRSCATAAADALSYVLKMQFRK